MRRVAEALETFELDLKIVVGCVPCRADVDVDVAVGR